MLDLHFPFITQINIEDEQSQIRSENCLTLGIPEASGFETELRVVMNATRTDSTCATLIFSLRIFGRKGMIVQKDNVDEIFTRNTVSLARHFSVAVAAD